jgi:hypothetical protein
MLLGLSGRYWISRALGVGVSFGESYSVATWSALASSSGGRFATFATFGAIDVSFVFGG